MLLNKSLFLFWVVAMLLLTSSGKALAKKNETSLLKQAEQFAENVAKLRVFSTNAHYKSKKLFAVDPNFFPQAHIHAEHYGKMLGRFKNYLKELYKIKPKEARLLYKHLKIGWQKGYEKGIFYLDYASTERLLSDYKASIKALDAFANRYSYFPL